GAGWIRHGDMTLHPSAKVSPDVLCIGPALIGRRANIPAGVTIVGSTVIGDDTVIEPGALVSRSVLGNSCRVAADAVVHGSVFAAHSIAGASTNLWHALNVRRPNRWRRLPDLFAPKREPRVAVGSIAGTVNSIAGRRA